MPRAVFIMFRRPRQTSLSFIGRAPLSPATFPQADRETGNFRLRCHSDRTGISWDLNGGICLNVDDRKRHCHSDWYGGKLRKTNYPLAVRLRLIAPQAWLQFVEPSGRAKL